MQTDYVQRFLFEDLDIRGRLVCLTGSWQRMLDGRGYPDDITALLGHTTALNVLLGANQKGAGRVTLQVQGSGPVKLLVADCTADLKIRGMASYDARPENHFRKKAPGERPPRRHPRGREERQRLPEPGAPRGQTMEQIFEHYLAQSEQVQAFLRLCADGGAPCGLPLRRSAPTATIPTAESRRYLANTLTPTRTADAQPCRP
jgi:molecular chaperone Hsp33